MLHQINHDASAKEKSMPEWLIKCAKIISADFVAQGHKMFAKNEGHYDLMRMYGMGKQPIDQYKKLKEVDEADDYSIMNVDWTPRGPGVKYRDIAIEKILDFNYSPVATPIDLQSKDENNLLYAQLEAKLMQREMVLATNPELANHPMLQMFPGEPQDMEELEMRRSDGEQLNRAKDKEQIVNLAFYENRVMDRLRPQYVKNLWDCGVAVWKDDLDADGRPFVRDVDLNNFGCSFCHKSDFSDMTYGFEVIPMPHSEMKPFFNEVEMEEIKNVRNYGLNPFSTIGFMYPHQKPNYDGNSDTCLVMDFELISYNTMGWEIGKSSYGNKQIKDVTNLKKATTKRVVKMVYRGKWIIGTNYIFEFGLKPNMKRRYADLRRASNTSLSYKAMAYNFNKMICGSYQERLKPLIDDYMMVMLTAQNVRNNLVANGHAFDLDALESIVLTDGGKTMDPMEVISMFYKRGIIVFRGTKISGQNGNGKPIEVTQNSVANEIVSLYMEASSIVEQMQDVTGLNKITDASTPGERTLNGVANLANNATNTALKPIIRADKGILVEMGNDLFLRAQQCVRKHGKYSGYYPTLNGTAMRFVEADAKTMDKDHAIMFEMMVTDEQRQMILSYMNETFAQGLLDPTDVITLLNTFNLKQAQQIWVHRIKKNKEEKRRQEIENQQMTFDGQIKAATAAEQKKGENIDKEYKWKMLIEKEITRRALLTARIKVTGDTAAAELEAEEQDEAAEDDLYMQESDMAGQEMPLQK